MQATKPQLRVIAGRPTKCVYARHGFYEAEPASAPADDLLSALVGAAYLLLGGLCLLGSLYCFALFMLALERVT
jgi:hypothetical protein